MIKKNNIQNWVLFFFSIYYHFIKIFVVHLYKIIKKNEFKNK